MFLLKTHKKGREATKNILSPHLKPGKQSRSRVRAQQPGLSGAAEDGAVLGKLPVRMMGWEME